MLNGLVFYINLGFVNNEKSYEFNNNSERGSSGNSEWYLSSIFNFIPTLWLFIINDLSYIEWTINYNLDNSYKIFLTLTFVYAYFFNFS